MVRLLSGAKFKLVVVVCCSVSGGFYSLQNSRFDDGCGDMIEDPRSNSSSHSWAPSQCKMMTYSSGFANRCFTRDSTRNETLIYLVGDSHQRLLGYNIYNLLTRGSTGLFTPNESKFSMWAPSAKLRIRYFAHNDIATTLRAFFRTWEDKNRLPDLVVVGYTLHPIVQSNGSAMFMSELRNRFTRELVEWNKMGSRIPVLWYIQPPVNELIMRSNRKMITNERVKHYGDIVTQMIRRTRMKAWSSVRRIAEMNPKGYKDDVHVGGTILHDYTQILLNFLCNNQLNEAEGNYCCAKRGSQTISVLNFWTIMTCLGTTSTLVVLYYEWKEETKEPRTEGAGYPKVVPPVLASSLKLISCLGFVFMCDRTPIFEKSTKYSSSSYSVKVMLAAVVVVLTYTKLPSRKRTQSLAVVSVNEFRGFLMTLYMFLKLESEDGSHAGKMLLLIESLLLFSSGFQFYREFSLLQGSNALFYFRTLGEEFTFPTLIILTLGQRYEFYPLVPLVFISFSVSFLFLSLPSWNPYESDDDDDAKKTTTTTTTVQIVMAASFVVLISQVVRLQVVVFSWRFWSFLFTTEEGTLLHWLKRWQILNYSYIGGVLFCHALSATEDLAARHKERLKWSLVGRDAVALVGVGALSSLFLLGYCSALPLSKGVLLLLTVVSFSSLALLKYLVWRVRKGCASLLSVIGESWMEIYVLLFHTWTSNDGAAVIDFVPHPFCGLVLAFVVTVHWGSEARRSTRDAVVRFRQFLSVVVPTSKHRFPLGTGKLSNTGPGQCLNGWPPSDQMLLVPMVRSPR